MTSLFETPKAVAPVYNVTAMQAAQPAPVPPPPPAPTATSPAVQQAAQDENASQQQAAGRASTILTGGQGVTSPANTIKAQLLGA